MSSSTTLNEILEKPYRLDAEFYASSVIQARSILQKAESNGIQIDTIKDLSKGTFNPPPIKRVFTDDQKRGTPYMIPQEMYDFYWEIRKYVYAKKMDKIEDWYLKANWTVLSQSGTVGKPYYSTKEDEKIILSQNAIRIPPKDPSISGYVYAYLSTWIGQTLLKKDKFGITVKHIRPNQVDAVPIPRLNPTLEKSISKKIKKAFELRVESIKLINDAKNEIYDELNAPHFNPSNDE